MNHTKFSLLIKNCFKLSFFLLTIVIIQACNNKTSTSVGVNERAVNSLKAQKQPYLILISLDGFRWDYVERFNPPNLSKFIKKGVQAASLIPSFPSKTFPNHYTIATGMYPDKHGIIGNSFYSYEKEKTYRIRNREVVEDGSFYQGTPIWVQASKSGMVTASYFFVGSEADIQGVRPDYYHRFDGSISKSTRVNTALQWLAMPQKYRPHMITMYFSDMDNVGHSYGPNNDEQLKKWLYDLDAALGKLFEGVKATKLPVNIIFVSDHGMLEVPIDKYIPLEKIKNEAMFTTITNGAIVSIHPNEGQSLEEVYNYLKSKEEHFKVYPTHETPYFEYEPESKNWGAFQVVPDSSYYFAPVRSIGFKKLNSNKIFGEHGFDHNMKELHGIFYGNGPAFKKGFTGPSIKNIHVYPLMCHILGLPVPNDIDGRFDEVSMFLKKKD